ncbi:hypothetical protein Phi47:1_gp68 [Cellulophaga phage phi47:1]|nr:hypothetical protein Phi3ST:2_gp68 [Cellulophaga phage phi3ST:2]AGO49307.1 hypothetical protein Phi38:2_gp68 [Cellulophaga phage phi38:2]AGO49805.1 hypothetical protein Phi47:1_gp68 [Cellulophaga phage phi47:1]
MKTSIFLLITGFLLILAAIYSLNHQATSNEFSYCIGLIGLCCYFKSVILVTDEKQEP